MITLYRVTDYKRTSYTKVSECIRIDQELYVNSFLIAYRVPGTTSTVVPVRI